MSFDYARLKSKTQKLIKKFGKEYTFTRTSIGDFNPSTGTAANTASTFAKQACIFDYSDTDRTDGAILRGDRRLMVEGYVYQVGDTVDIDGVDYTVVNVSNIAPNGEVVASNLQVRK